MPAATAAGGQPLHPPRAVQRTLRATAVAREGGRPAAGHAQRVGQPAGAVRCVPGRAPCWCGQVCARPCTMLVRPGVCQVLHLHPALPPHLPLPPTDLPYPAFTALPSLPCLPYPAFTALPSLPYPSLPSRPAFPALPSRPAFPALPSQPCLPCPAFPTLPSLPFVFLPCAPLSPANSAKASLTPLYPLPGPAVPLLIWQDLRPSPLPWQDPLSALVDPPPPPLALPLYHSYHPLSPLPSPCPPPALYHTTPLYHHSFTLLTLPLHHSSTLPLFHSTDPSLHLSITLSLYQARTAKAVQGRPTVHVEGALAPSRTHPPLLLLPPPAAAGGGGLAQAALQPAAAR